MLNTTAHIHTAAPLDAAAHLPPIQQRTLSLLAAQLDGGEPFSAEALQAVAKGQHGWAPFLGIGLEQVEECLRSAEESLGTHQTARARRGFELVTLLHPMNPLGHIGLGRIALGGGEPEKALAHFERALQHHGSDLGASAGKALAMLELDLEGAETAVNAALEADPEGSLTLTGVMARAWFERFGGEEE